MIVRSDAKVKHDPIPAGVTIGTCYGIIDLGTLTEDSPMYGRKTQRKLLVQWECPEHRIEVDRDGKKVDMPRAISKRYTLSLRQKANLRKDLESWRGKAFTEAEEKAFLIDVLLGKSCQILVQHVEGKNGTFAKVTAIMPLPKGMPAPKMENEGIIFSFDDWNGDDLPAAIPDWVKKIMMESEEWQTRHNPVAPAHAEPDPVDTTPPDDEDMPF